VVVASLVGGAVAVAGCVVGTSVELVTRDAVGSVAGTIDVPSSLR